MRFKEAIRKKKILYRNQVENTQKKKERGVGEGMEGAISGEK